MISKHLNSYKSGRNVVYSCKYHIVFTPKLRRKVLINGVDARLEEILKQLCLEMEVELIEFEIMPEHVHLLVDINPSFGVNQFISKLKGRSARILRSEFPFLKSKIPCLWTSSYFCTTVGGATLEVIKQYIENQKNV
jgi:putative transposase